MPPQIQGYHPKGDESSLPVKLCKNQFSAEKGFDNPFLTRIMPVVGSGLLYLPFCVPLRV
jgi:hypothetical protein